MKEEEEKEKKGTSKELKIRNMHQKYLIFFKFQ